LPKLIQRIEIAKDFAQTLIDSTVTTVQAVHTSIADATYNIVSQNSLAPEKFRQVKEKHDSTANLIYDTLRDVNKNLGQLASDYFEKLEDSVEIDKVISKSKSSSSH
jgi:hypothetical protein